MKQTRKLIPALVMLLISAIMLSTSSYAWFASRLNVEANNMNVQVTSDARFLQIKNISGEYGIEAPGANTTTAPQGIELITAEITGEGETKKTVTWKQGNSNSVTDHHNGEALTEYAGDVKTDGKCVLYNEFKVALAEGSQGVLNNLVASAVTVSGDASDAIRKCLRVLVIGNDGVQLYSLNSGTPTLDATKSNDYLLETVQIDDGTLGNTNVIEVYIYFDGMDENATTNNLPANPQDVNYSVTITFSASK